MTFQREDKRVVAGEILQALAEGQDIDLHRCTVSGEVNLNRLFVPGESFDLSGIKAEHSEEGRVLTLSQAITFDSCIFEENVFFAAPWDRPGVLRVIFEGDVYFNSSVFRSPVRFSGGCFKGTACFDGCVFERATCFRLAVFCGKALFRTATFDRYGLFNGCRFEDEARFVNTCLNRGANFTNARFESLADFGGVFTRSKAVPVHDGIHFTRRRFGDDESFWRFIKQACQEGGYYQQAGESFYRERCANFWKRFRGADYERLTGVRRFVRILAGIRLVPELLIGRWLFGYGERPVRVLMGGFLVILGCAVFFASSLCLLMEQSSRQPAELSFFDGLYFSVITFTTVGFGEMYPAEDVLTRFVVMAEALCGICLMPLFVVSLAKRFARG